MLIPDLQEFANSVGPDETAPVGAVSSGPALFAIVKNAFFHNFYHSNDSPNEYSQL